MEQMRTFIEGGLPRLIAPIAILVIGWVVAYGLGALTRAGLRRTLFDDRLAVKTLGAQRAARIDTARWGGKLVYYVALAFVALAFLQSLNFTAAGHPIGSLLNQLLSFVPRLLGAAAIGLVAWVVASLARGMVSAALRKLDVDRKFQGQLKRETHATPGAGTLRGPQAPTPPTAAGTPSFLTQSREAEVSTPVSNVVYWVVLLLFAPAILGALNLQGLLRPVEDMMQRALTFLPNIISAGLILFVGWFVARALQRVVTGLLSSAGLDRLSERTGVTKALGAQSLSNVAGVVVYALILIPVAIGALNALRLEAITAPAGRMLETFLAAVPSIFGAALLMVIAYVAARLIAGVVRNVLQGIGFDNVLVKLGFQRAQVGEHAPSQMIASATLVAIVYFAALEAARLLGFESVAALGAQVAVRAGHILLGLAIFGLGMYLANLAARAIRQSDTAQASILSTLARIAVLALSGAMALRQMGLANEIIELAFGLTLGAVAVAAGIAFGLGGREAAAQLLGDMRTRLRERSERTGEHQVAE